MINVYICNNINSNEEPPVFIMALYDLDYLLPFYEKIIVTSSKMYGFWKRSHIFICLLPGIKSQKPIDFLCIRLLNISKIENMFTFIYQAWYFRKCRMIAWKFVRVICHALPFAYFNCIFHAVSMQSFENAFSAQYILLAIYL